MDEILIVDIKPQLVLGIRKTCGYEEIATVIQKLCEYAVSKNIEMTGRPIFVCHEKTAEEVIEAFEQKNADVEVAIPILKWWIKEKHKKIVGPTREIYLNDPGEVLPEEILTDIYAPID